MSKNLSNIQYETIIVNDGSTDAETIHLLGTLDMEEYRILHQTNQGPAAARNTGVKSSSGHYLLFLDSDNKLKAGCIGTSIKLLKKTNADIVYGKPNFFGTFKRLTYTAGPFDMNTILLTNYIDVCSMIRRKVWEEIGGFDEAKVLIGFEDWDFWIRAGKAGYNFRFVDELFFDYRISHTSLLSSKNTTDNYNKVVEYIYTKHSKTVFNAYRNLYPQLQVYERDQTLPMRSFFKFFYIKYIKPFYSIEKKWQRDLKEHQL